MVAVVRAAIEDVQDAAAAEKALDYLTSTDRDWPFSFENLCDALDMSAADVRRRLTWRHAPLPSPASAAATDAAERAPTASGS